MITAIGDVMRKCYDRGWITTRDGNASLRRGGSKCVYITPSGARKNKIEVESIIKMRIDSAGGLHAPDNVSGEIHMHWKLLMGADKTRCILHVHPTHIVAAMYAGFDLATIAADFPEIYRYTKVGPNVPNLPATSQELGDVTFLALKGASDLDGPDLSFDIVGQANHGVCAVGANPWAAYEHIERLDHICEIVLKSGVKPKSNDLLHF
jgi:ribulose-5-phosphate 4-epimerase/fuculose-1-phosphate aldolase